MPIYSYQCENAECGHAFEHSLPISEYKSPQDCPECEGSTKKLITPIGFILKGDDWAGKNLRIKKQMATKNRHLSGKENEMKRDGPRMTLAPNVGGERVESWADAQKLAASKGKETSSYNSLVHKERSTA
jgi:putative FmdB family regulatory protein